MNSPVFEDILLVRKATNDDLNVLNQIYYHSKAYWGYDNNYLTKFMALYKLDAAYLAKHGVWVLLSKDKIIGYYGFFTEEDGSIELDHFFLSPEYIGKGYGKKLWQFCCETAKAMGKNEFILWSEPGAETFYAKMGCEKIGIRNSEPLHEQHIAAEDLPAQQPSALMFYRISS